MKGGDGILFTLQHDNLSKFPFFFKLKQLKTKLEIFFLYYFTVYCNWTFDSFLCWPPTKAGELALQKCPPTKGLDPTSKFIKTKKIKH
jgi:hypothetical protein